jgi:hypothetical protein
MELQIRGVSKTYANGAPPSLGASHIGKGHTLRKPLLDRG